MSQSKLQILIRVAIEIGKLASGQALDSNLEGRLSDSYDQVYDELNQKGLANWAPDSVGNAYVPHVVNLVASLNLEGTPTSKQQKILALAQLAQLKIANLNNAQFTNKTQVSDF